MSVAAIVPPDDASELIESRSTHVDPIRLKDHMISKPPFTRTTKSPPVYAACDKMGTNIVPQKLSGNPSRK